MCARRQAEILDCAAVMLRPGGRLVYSTCTFAPQEDEEAVAAFLARHPEFEAEPVNAPWFQESRPGMYRLWPHKLLGEGHFAAVLCLRGHRHRSRSRRFGSARGNGVKHRLDIRQFLAQHFDLQLVRTVIACFSDLRKQLTVPPAESVDFLAHRRLLNSLMADAFSPPSLPSRPCRP